MKTLVLVHGFMGAGAQWQSQVAGLSDQFDIVAPDLPGFGQNNHLPVIDTIGGFADWVIAHLRAQGIRKYHLMGHSMGGMIVQEMARRDGEAIEKLVLYGTGAVGVLPGRFETIAESKRRVHIDGKTATARRISATWFLKTDADPAYAGCAALAEQSAAEALPAGLDAMQTWSGVAGLKTLAQETLVVWGDRDRTYAWEQTAQLWNAVSRSSLAVVPGCAHAAHLEKPALFNMIIDDFLRDT